MPWPFRRPPPPPPPADPAVEIAPVLVAILCCCFAFKLFVHAAIVGSAWCALGGDATAAVVQATVWLLIVLLAFPSGAFLNSAITLAACAAGKLAQSDAVLYIGAQFAGSAVAVEAIRALAPLDLHGAIGPPPPAEGSYSSAILHEALFAGANCLLALNSSALGTGTPLKVATIVILLIRIGGACMDPSAAFAGALFAGRYTDLVEVYCVGAALGAIAAGTLSR
ncbi:hypothetical protein EMIHUDRAFT_223840 [Emiliania huxleyi CCMP1516]|uniref:Uncharacterized protein n=2 Tax=Emiliania huxleyi TaxID=2903 RepID=A0A0D3KTB3_EMIH1|nr:hypothetical protein EMIHUDRAFT_223840 [Emiliania huxleyi CCMP1516]EOD38998.1 hypothetical protein EMIHUDRAFT_223840 [Emiliania huxleyi CCMP1516]|eukprot:XP_005791427.1 hypothetical protein EMIHUDRAFT_223840 [Emiliania huxleyi CCMP1516]